MDFAPYSIKDKSALSSIASPPATRFVKGFHSMQRKRQVGVIIDSFAAGDEVRKWISLHTA
jgi:hypothetical protein